MWSLLRYIFSKFTVNRMKFCSKFYLMPKILNVFFFWFHLQFNTMQNALARCPHCRKVSSVGPEFTRNRGILFLALGILFLIIGICVTWSTYQYAKVSSTLQEFLLKFLIKLKFSAESRWNICSLYWSIFDCFVPVRSYSILLYVKCKHHRWTDVNEMHASIIAKLVIALTYMLQRIVSKID